jgi:hypothetical protein
MVCHIPYKRRFELKKAANQLLVHNGSAYLVA